MMNGKPSRDELEAMYKDTKRRKNSYAEAHMNQESVIAAMRVEITRITSDRDRLSAALEAERMTNQLLITDGNTRYRAANDEVERLRVLCKLNGIDPNREE